MSLPRMRNLLQEAWFLGQAESILDAVGKPRTLFVLDFPQLSETSPCFLCCVERRDIEEVGSE